MNSTNRAANRLFLLIVGIIALALGAAAVVVGAVADIRTAWSDTAPAVADETTRVLGDPATAWIWYAVLAALVIVVVVLLVFVFRQGRGHTSRIVSSPETDAGRTVVESAFAEQLLSSALGARPEFVSTSVSTYAVRREPVLKVAVTARRGVSPTDVVDIVERTARDMDSLLGVQIPILVHISGGFRSRVSSATRLQ